MNGKLAAPPLPPPSGKPWPVRVMEVEQQSEGDDADCGVHVVNNVARFIKASGEERSGKRVQKGRSRWLVCVHEVHTQ